MTRASDMQRGGAGRGRMMQLVWEREREEDARRDRSHGTLGAPGENARGEMLLDAIEGARAIAGGGANGCGSSAPQRLLRALGASEHLFTVALFAIIVAVLLLALFAGTGVYRTMRGLEGAAASTRLGTSFITNAARSLDAANSVDIAEGPEGTALVLSEHLDSGAFETRFYLHEGSVVQEYALAGAPYNPEGATQVLESSSFDAAYDDESGLLTVETDEGTANVALRSATPGKAGGDAA